MPDYKQILDELSQELIKLAKSTFINYQKDAEADITAFYNDSKQDLEHWTAEFVLGDIDKDNLTSLIKGQKDILKMEALTQKGITLSTLQQFRDDATNLILNTIFSKLV